MARVAQGSDTAMVFATAVDRSPGVWLADYTTRAGKCVLWPTNRARR